MDCIVIDEDSPSESIQPIPITNSNEQNGINLKRPRDSPSKSDLATDQNDPTPAPQTTQKAHTPLKRRKSTTSGDQSTDNNNNNSVTPPSTPPKVI